MAWRAHGGWLWWFDGAGWARGRRWCLVRGGVEQVGLGWRVLAGGLGAGEWHELAGAHA